MFLGATTTPEFGWKGGGDSPSLASRATRGTSAHDGRLVGRRRRRRRDRHGPAARRHRRRRLGPDARGVLRHRRAEADARDRADPSGGGVGDAQPRRADGPHGARRRAPDGGDRAARRRDVYPSLRDDRPWLDGIEDGVAGLRIAYAPRFARADVDPRIAAASTPRYRCSRVSVRRSRSSSLPGPTCATRSSTLWDAALGRALRGMTDEQLAMSDPGLVATMRRRARDQRRRLPRRGRGPRGAHRASSRRCCRRTTCSSRRRCRSSPSPWARTSPTRRRRSTGWTGRRSPTRST